MERSLKIFDGALYVDQLDAAISALEASSTEPLPMVFETTKPCCLMCCFCCSCNAVTIPDNYTAIVYKCGRYVGQWRGGPHTVSPHVTIYRIYFHGDIIYKWTVEDVATLNEGKTIKTVEGHTVFHVEADVEKQSYNFACKFGPRSLKEMMDAHIEEAVRVSGRLVTRDSFAFHDKEELLEELKGKSKEYGVNILSVEIDKIDFGT